MALETVSLVKGMSPEHKLLVAWIAAPLIYDLIAREGGTFSEGIHRLRRKHPLLVDAAIDITAQHFKERLPKRIDPFHQALKAVKGENKMKIHGEDLGLWAMVGWGAAGGLIKHGLRPAFEDHVVRPAKGSIGRFTLSKEAPQPEAEIAQVHKLGELASLPVAAETESPDLGMAA